MYTIPEIIQLAQISQYLADNDIAMGKQKDKLFGIKLYVERKSVSWAYLQDPTDTTLTKTSNYLYTLCGQYAAIAAGIAGTSGGIVPSPVSGVIYRTYEYFFVVGESGSLVLDGGNSFVLQLGAGAVFTKYEGLFQLTVNQVPLPNTTNVNYLGFQTSFNALTGDLTISLSNAQVFQNTQPVSINMAFAGSQQPIITPV